MEFSRTAGQKKPPAPVFSGSSTLPRVFTKKHESAAPAIDLTPLMTISGQRILKPLSASTPKNPSNTVVIGAVNMSRSVSSNSAARQANNDGRRLTSEEEQAEEEEAKWDAVSVASSDTSNLYVDDGEDEDGSSSQISAASRGSFNAFMRKKVEGNSNVKRTLMNHMLDEKRREHDEEQELLRKQTSKPFRMSRSKLNSKQHSIASGETGGLLYDGSTEYGSKNDMESSRSAVQECLNENDDDAAADNLFDMDSVSVDGAERRLKQRNKLTSLAATSKLPKPTLTKPFKISDLKKAAAAAENNNAQQPTKIHLSAKEKRRVADEAAVLKKSRELHQLKDKPKQLSRSTSQQSSTSAAASSSTGLWTVYESAATIASQKAAREKRESQIQQIEKSLQSIDKKMSKKNKVKVMNLLTAGTDEQAMTEFDVQLAEREAFQFAVERSNRMRELENFVGEDSVDDLSEMSAQDIRNRAAFITDFTKKRGARSTIFNDDASVASTQPSGGDSLQQQRSSTPSQQLPETFFIQRNIGAAFKSRSEQAEDGFTSYLPEPARKRLEELLVGCDSFDLLAEEERILSEGSPFELEEEDAARLASLLQRLQQVGMDEVSVQAILGHELFSMSNAILPKDSILREEAENTILREKLASVNERLHGLFETEKRKEEGGQSKVACKVEKIKIQDLVAKLQLQAQLADEQQEPPSQELLNLVSDFEDNAKLLEESRDIIARLSTIPIERDIGEYRELLTQATIAQIEYEQTARIKEQDELMEEQKEIVEELKEQLQNITKVQEEIREKETKLIQGIVDSQLQGVFGITLTNGEEGEGEAKEMEYEVEDLQAIIAGEQKKLQAEIEQQLAEIQRKYEGFSESVIDERMAEMREIDSQIVLQMNPNEIELLTEEVKKQQLEEDQEIALRASQFIRFNGMRLYNEKAKENDRQRQELEESALNQDGGGEGATAVESKERQKEAAAAAAAAELEENSTRFDGLEEYYKKKKEIEENLRIIEEINATKKRHQSPDEGEEEQVEEQKKFLAYTQQQSQPNDQQEEQEQEEEEEEEEEEEQEKEEEDASERIFEDSLEM